MILGYLMRKINILLLVFIITGCSNINTNNFNIYDDIFVTKEVNCPLINSPKGSEELIAISEKKNNTSYDSLLRQMEKNNTEDKRKSKKRDQQEELPAKGPTWFDMSLIFEYSM